MTMQLIPVDRNLGDPIPPNCLQCGTPFRRSLIGFDLEGKFLGFFPADVCQRGHTYLTQESSRAIDEVAKRTGLWARAIASPASTRIVLFTGVENKRILRQTNRVSSGALPPEFLTGVPLESATAGGD